MKAKRLTPIFLLLLLIVSSVEAQNQRLAIGGIERSYYLPNPPADKTSVRGILFVFHGAGGTGEQMARYTGLTEASAGSGLLVVYPDGIQGHWNDGRGLTETNDIGFVRGMIVKIAGEYGLKEPKVFLTGFSNGGFFSTFLACKLPEVHGLGVVSATMPKAVAWKCKPNRPLTVLYFFGDKDTMMPMKGAEDNSEILPLDSVVALWVKANKAKGHWQTAEKSSSGCKVDYEKWGDGSSQVESYLLQGGGHTWPGSQPLMPKFLGPTCPNVDASAILVKSFAARLKTTE